MAKRIPDTLLNAQGIGPREKLILIIISWQRDQNGVAKLGYRKLARFAGIGLSTAHRTIEQLHRRNFITVIHGQKTVPNQYIINFEQIKKGSEKNDTQTIR